MSEFTVVPLELRRAGGDQHILEGLCVPYGRTSHKTEFPAGERFMPGSFASLLADPSAAGKVRLRATHGFDDEQRPVGVGTGFSESADGLMGRFRFYNTPEGRGGWENVVEETYGGLSVGFFALRDRKASDGAREVVEAHLHHVALVDEPAYDEAQVLAVRESAMTVEAARARLAALGSVDPNRLTDRVDLSSALLR